MLSGPFIFANFSPDASYGIMSMGRELEGVAEERKEDADGEKPAD